MNLSYNGVREKSMFCFVPALGSLPGGLSIVSSGNALKFGINSDKSCIKDVKRLEQIWQEVIEKEISKLIL